jgi:hypothetical protein
MVKKKRLKTSDARPKTTEKISPRRETDTKNSGKDSTLERVELLAASAADREDMEADGLGERLNELAATSEEEVDALKINLLQEDEHPSARDGSGLIVDDAAEERIARFTEADPMQSNLGALSVEPGRDDTSSILRRHNLNSTIARSDTVVESNLDEPMDETVNERKVDEGTAG